MNLNIEKICTTTQLHTFTGISPSFYVPMNYLRIFRNKLLVPKSKL